MAQVVLPVPLEAGEAAGPLEAVEQQTEAAVAQQTLEAVGQRTGEAIGQQTRTAAEQTVDVEEQMQVVLGLIPSLELH